MEQMTRRDLQNGAYHAQKLRHYSTHVRAIVPARQLIHPYQCL
ncbi:MAG TPA: hypothetical protein VIX20_17145 [Ktedonobacteraceae bacterium]